MATLKDIAEFQAEIEAKGFREIDDAVLVDMLESLADVQGVLNINNAPFDPLNANAVNHTCDGGWQQFALWEESTDTKGVREHPAPGSPPFDSYEIRPNGGGTWKTTASIRCTCDTAGLIQIRQAVIDTDGTTVMTEPFRDRLDVQADEVFKLSYRSLILNVLPDQQLMMQIRGPVGAVITVHEGQFFVDRG